MVVMSATRLLFLFRQYRWNAYGWAVSRCLFDGSALALAFQITHSTCCYAFTRITSGSFISCAMRSNPSAFPFAAYLGHIPVNIRRG